MRLLILPAVVVFVSAVPAWAQAPDAGPMTLNLAPSARPAALAQAWVAGRDHDVIFYNPAQLISARPGVDLSLTRFGPDATMASVASTYAAGKWSLTLGWGVELVSFSAPSTSPYPYSPDVLLERGPVSGFGALLAAGGAFVYKGFRIGAAGKYASDHVSTRPGEVADAPVNPHAFVADLGVARNVFGGVAAFSAQNLGHGSTDDGSTITVPKQILAGWSATKQAGPLDLGVYGQVTVRDEWTSPAAGLEVGYTWIEGCTVTLRAGTRRPLTGAEQPIALGAGLTIDRVTVDYAVQFFEGGRATSAVTFRWR